MPDARSLSHGGALAQIKRWQEMIDAMPKPISYIVLDPSMPITKLIDSEDGEGRRYVMCSSAVLDEMGHRKIGPLDVLTNEALPLGFLGAITIRKREDMREGWPDVT